MFDYFIFLFFKKKYGLKESTTQFMVKFGVKELHIFLATSKSLLPQIFFLQNFFKNEPSGGGQVVPTSGRSCLVGLDQSSILLKREII